MIKAYVRLLMDIIGRGLVTLSQIDPDIQDEIQHLPVGLTFSMQIFASDIAFYVKVNSKNQLEQLPHPPKKIDLTIKFKHIRHAFLVFSFQESTAQAFANDRMIADGDLSTAILFVRCLNRLEALILPKKIASLAIKKYPNNLSTQTKIQSASQIYFKIVMSYFKRNS